MLEIIIFIIDDSQFCMPKKEIGELILFYQSIIDDAKYDNSDQALAFLDFEKAFDSVDHEFTFNMMETVGIPLEFIKWAKLAFCQTTACVMVNGKRSPFFGLPGGGRQGEETCGGQPGYRGWRGHRGGEANILRPPPQWTGQQLFELPESRGARCGL